MARAGSSSVSALRREVDRLASEVEELAESLGSRSCLAQEEAVGAEILATRDLVAHLGIYWETLDRLVDIAGRQWQHLSSDYRNTVSELEHGGAGGVGSALGNHALRRFSHLAEGLGESLEVMSSQSQKACDTLFRLWSPFFSVVRRDWSDGHSGAKP